MTTDSFSQNLFDLIVFIKEISLKLHLITLYASDIFIHSESQSIQLQFISLCVSW